MRGLTSIERQALLITAALQYDVDVDANLFEMCEAFVAQGRATCRRWCSETSDGVYEHYTFDATDLGRLALRACPTQIGIRIPAARDRVTA